MKAIIKIFLFVLAFTAVTTAQDKYSWEYPRAKLIFSRDFFLIQHDSIGYIAPYKTMKLRLDSLVYFFRDSLGVVKIEDKAFRDTLSNDSLGFNSIPYWDNLFKRWNFLNRDTNKVIGFDSTGNIGAFNTIALDTSFLTSNSILIWSPVEKKFKAKYDSTKILHQFIDTLNATMSTVISRVDTNETSINSNSTAIAQNLSSINFWSLQTQVNKDTLVQHLGRININSGNITSTVQTVNSNTGRISINESKITQLDNEIDLRVKKDSIISYLNISPELVKIKSNLIQIDGQTVFASGYNPMGKIDIGNAASDINSHTTTINGDKIKSGYLQSNNWSTTAGTQFNLNDGTFKMGGSSSPALQFDGTDLKVKGSLISGNAIFGKEALPNLNDGIYFDNDNWWDAVTGHFAIGGAEGFYKDGTGFHFGANVTIDGDLINNRTITNLKIVNKTITYQEIANSTIDSALIGTAAISSANIKSLTADKIKSGYLTSLNYGASSGIKFDLNNGKLYFGNYYLDFNPSFGYADILETTARLLAPELLLGGYSGGNIKYVNNISFGGYFLGYQGFDISLVRSGGSDVLLFKDNYSYASKSILNFDVDEIQINGNSLFPFYQTGNLTNSFVGTDETGNATLINRDYYSRVFRQSGYPSSSLGNTGDIYFDISTSTIYIKTGSTTWDEVVLK